MRILIGCFILSATALSAVSQTNRVTFRDDTTILLNDRPFFPIGLYYAGPELADPTGTSLDRIRQIGFNMVHYAGAGVKDELDRLAQRGMYVFWRPPGGLHSSHEQMLKTVNEYKNHPAVLFWEFEDEPVYNNVDFDSCRRGAELLRQADTNHPIILTQWPEVDNRPTYVKWASLADVNAYDFYPVPLVRWQERAAKLPPDWPYSIAVIGPLSSYWRQLAPDKPLLVVLQAWSWDPIKFGRDGYPSWRDGRFMVYQSVIRGAKALNFYGRLHHEPLPTTQATPGSEEARQFEADHQLAQQLNDWFWPYYTGVIRETADMAHVFTSPDADWKPNIEIVGSTEPTTLVEHRAKSVEGGAVILLINGEPRPLTIRISAPALAGKTIHSWHEGHTRNADVHGAFTDRVEPFGVKIYSDTPGPK